MAVMHLRDYVDMSLDILKDIDDFNEWLTSLVSWLELVEQDVSIERPDLGDAMALLAFASIVTTDIKRTKQMILRQTNIDGLRAAKDLIRPLQWVASNIDEFSPVFTDLWETIKNRLIEITEKTSAARRQALDIIKSRIDEELKSTGRLGEAYKQYLQTPEWKLKRQQKLEQANYRCQKCERTASLEVHHLNYSRIPFEWDADLIVLCDKHHDQAHGRLIA